MSVSFSLAAVLPWPWPAAKHSWSCSLTSPSPAGWERTRRTKMRNLPGQCKGIVRWRNEEENKQPKSPKWSKGNHSPPPSSWLMQSQSESNGHLFSQQKPFVLPLPPILLMNTILCGVISPLVSCGQSSWLYSLPATWSSSATNLRKQTEKWKITWWCHANAVQYIGMLSIPLTTNPKHSTV